MAPTQSELINFLRPKACPVPLLRIGGVRDGAYLVPNDLQGIEACFSPGVNNLKNFEDELAVGYGIKSHMCDFSSDVTKFRTPLIEGMQTFEKKWLDSDGVENSMSLESWINQYSPLRSHDLILQMDIEGAEYRNLLAASEATLSRFRIIVIELHGLKAFMRQDLADKQVVPLLTKLDSTHICVHAHPNNCCGIFIDPATGRNIPNVIELTLLRRDRFSSNPRNYIEPQLPHPLDITRNARGKPPLHLNEKWLESQRRSVESRTKVLEDELDFAKWEISQLKKPVA